MNTSSNDAHESNGRPAIVKVGGVAMAFGSKGISKSLVMGVSKGKVRVYLYLTYTSEKATSFATRKSRLTLRLHRVRAKDFMKPV